MVDSVMSSPSLVRGGGVERQPPPPPPQQHPFLRRQLASDDDATAVTTTTTTTTYEPSSTIYPTYNFPDYYYSDNPVVSYGVRTTNCMSFTVQPSEEATTTTTTAATTTTTVGNTNSAGVLYANEKSVLFFNYNVLGSIATSTNSAATTSTSSGGYRSMSFMMNVQDWVSSFGGVSSCLSLRDYHQDLIDASVFGDDTNNNNNNGLFYYWGPICKRGGFGITMGVFLDADCTQYAPTLSTALDSYLFDTNNNNNGNGDANARQELIQYSSTTNHLNEYYYYDYNCLVSDNDDGNDVDESTTTNTMGSTCIAIFENAVHADSCQILDGSSFTMSGDGTSSSSSSSSSNTITGTFYQSTDDDNTDRPTSWTDRLSIWFQTMKGRGSSSSTSSMYQYHLSAKEGTTMSLSCPAIQHILESTSYTFDEYITDLMNTAPTSTNDDGKMINEQATVNGLSYVPSSPVSWLSDIEFLVVLVGGIILLLLGCCLCCVINIQIRRVRRRSGKHTTTRNDGMMDHHSSKKEPLMVPATSSSSDDDSSEGKTLPPISTSRSAAAEAITRTTTKQGKPLLKRMDEEEVERRRKRRSSQSSSDRSTSAFHGIVVDDDDDGQPEQHQEPCPPFPLRQQRVWKDHRPTINVGGDSSDSIFSGGEEENDHDYDYNLTQEKDVGTSTTDSIFAGLDSNLKTTPNNTEERTKTILGRLRLLQKR
jgi:hypothetical protein